MIASLELNWLKKYDKSLSNPLIIFTNDFYAGGCYYSPENSEELIDNKYYPLNKGLILINYSCFLLQEDFADAISHEWRHHWQHHNLYTKYDGIGWENTDDYDEFKINTINYFKFSKMEMDALLFSAKVASSDITKERLEWIIKDYEKYRKS